MQNTLSSTKHTQNLCTSVSDWKKTTNNGKFGWTRNSIQQAYSKSCWICSVKHNEVRSNFKCQVVRNPKATVTVMFHSNHHAALENDVIVNNLKPTPLPLGQHSVVPF